MKVLITGAGGFAAGHLARSLLKSGHEVYGLVRTPAKMNGLTEAGVRPVVTDLRDRSGVERALRGMSTVYHLAAVYRENLPVRELYQTNVEGTRNVFEAAAKYAVERVVHCSTVGVHGNIDHPPADEGAPFKPYDDYQKSKLEGERVAQDFIRRGVPGVVYRPVGMYGPGDSRFLKLFRSIRNGTFVMFGHGGALYHLTYIEDIVRGVRACGEHPGAVGETFIIAGPKAVTLNDLVAKIARALGVHPPRKRLPFGLLWSASVLCEELCRPLHLKPPLFRRRADWFRKDRSFTTVKLQNTLGVHPQMDLDEGLRRTVAWYREKQLI